MPVNPMLTVSEALHWTQIGFCIAVGFGIARYLWVFLYWPREELTDWEVKKWVKEQKRQQEFQRKIDAMMKEERGQ